MMDIITYAGEVNFEGYEKLCEALKKKQAEEAVLVLATPGGDPHAGFRIARALQHHYQAFDALVPRYCKSAGTLIVIGARKLYLDDMSELGPLDIQVKKGDELYGRSSGLEIFQAMNFLPTQALSQFRTFLLNLTMGAGLSTRVASDIATRLVGVCLEPIAAQIDPLKLAEMQRANEIAFEYGERLNERSQNLVPLGLAKLIAGYPSHGFVIDRKEARTIFARVEKPVDGWGKLSEAIHNHIHEDTNAKVPNVLLIPADVTTKEAKDGKDLPEPEAASTGPAAVVAEGGDSSPADGSSATSAPVQTDSEPGRGSEAQP